MKNEDLVKLKIDIQTNDDTNFLELAILLDKPKFLRLLPQLRKDYGIERLIDLKDYYRKTDSFKNSKKAKLNFSKYQNSKKLIEYARKNNTGFDDIEDEMDLFQLLDTETNLLCYIFKRPPYFSESIKQAILCNAVNDDCFKTTSVEVIEHDAVLSTTGSFQLPQVAILISPTSTDIKIENAIYSARKLFRTDRRLSYYKPRTDKVDRICSYREWYWQKIEGKKLVDIAKDWLSRPDVDPNDSGSDASVISKGISRYKNLLSL